MHEMKQREYIGNIKIENNMRILTMNIHRYRPEQYNRLKLIKEAIIKFIIDIALFNEANTKWIIINISRVEKVMRIIEKGIKIYIADSKQWKTIKNSYLPGRLLNIIKSRYTSIINKKKIKIRRVGTWIAFEMQYKSKRLKIINLYYISTAGAKANGICSSLTRYQLSNGKAKTANEYRKETLKKIKNYMHQNNNISDIIIAGDCNQDIHLNEILKFCEDIGVKDMYTYLTNFDSTQLGNTYKHGSKPIDSIAATNRLINYINEL